MAIALLLTLPGAVLAQDFDRYAALTEAAGQAFAVLADDSAEEERSDAIDSSEQVVDWLRAFENSSSFADLPSDQQESVLTDRHRWEYDIARQSLELGQCVDARDRIGALLEDGVRDPELLPRVSATFAEATTCAMASRYGTVTIEATPADTQVVIDGIAFGTSALSHRVEIGSHELTLNAVGYLSLTSRFELSEPDEELLLGPYRLAPEPVISPLPDSVVEPLPERPMLPSNILLGSSVALGVSGLGLLVAGQRHQRLASNPDDGQELVDPAREQRVVRNFRMGGVTCLVAAAASATTGILIRSSRDRAVTASLIASTHFAGLALQVQ
ncbi:MAG: hypothetical protein ACJAYU_004615 [Bradymonadia bacterium]